MKTHYWILGMVLAVGGCATHAKTFYDRPNTAAAQVSQDYAACQLYAMNRGDKPTDVVSTYEAGEHAGIVGQIANGMSRDNREEKAGRLCMQAKGYRLMVKK